jgi:diguanylate cyclase (GGDEF)-like protein
LHQVWTRTVFQLVAFIVVLGVIALAATQFQRVAFQDTTSALKQETSALATLTQALVNVNGAPTRGVLYGDPEDLNQNLAAYANVEARVNAAFGAAERAVSTPSETATLARAMATWRSLDVVIVTAPATFSHTVVIQAVASGQDPFQQRVWDPLNDTEADIADVAQQSAAQLGRRTATISGEEDLIAPLVAGALVLALMVGGLSARRMSRQVLNPILQLRRAALAMRDSTLEHAIDLRGATAELQDLAATINTTASSLRSSHGLLRDQAYTDVLTGLPNRKAFTERLHEKLDTPGGGRLGVLFIDLDDFKVVNDSLGHAAGDELLRIVAGRLRAATRGCEIVARLGGDEFAVALDFGDRPGSATPVAVAVAERILAAFQERISIEGTVLSVGCSVGIALSPAGAGVEAADELLRNADFSMYTAKGQGKNCFEVFAPSMHTEMVARTEFKRELSQAVRGEQFVLHYQPVVDLASGDLIGFEALIRWQHPLRGLLAPVEFIDLAEDTGDIVEIGHWVIDQACRDLAARHVRTKGASTSWVSVNLSGHQLTDPGFAGIVKDALERHDLRPASLMLELTESVAITNTAAATEALAELRRYGVHVALDDFGMGFSSLRWLHELPIDVIKIDRAFVMNKEGDAHLMLDAIVTLGRSLGLQVIAEGIEQSSELERLRAFGQLAGQGFLIARPMPVAEAAKFLRFDLLSEQQVTSEQGLATLTPAS